MNASDLPVFLPVNEAPVDFTHRFPLSRPRRPEQVNTAFVALAAAAHAAVIVDAGGIVHRLHADPLASARIEWLSAHRRLRSSPDLVLRAKDTVLEASRTYLRDLVDRGVLAESTWDDSGLAEPPPASSDHTAFVADNWATISAVAQRLIDGHGRLEGSELDDLHKHG